MILSGAAAGADPERGVFPGQMVIRGGELAG